ncbi:MAG: CoA pyrophosphatase [Steroidobacteraceae bacterium]|nr:CoA pyrophosphatase [Steroidobacteraceae bacterium]MBP9130506.1 CoA pyrophosphatase [Steroidobacteraceae bacterium]
MTVPDLNATRPLRTRIENLLRDTVPGRDPEFPYAAQFTPVQIDLLRKMLPAEPARAAVLVPLVERPTGLQVLLTQRASHLKNHPGQVSFPGGRIELADAGPWEAALREAREEIGLEPRFVTRAGYLQDHLVISGYRVTPAVGFVQPGFDLRLDETEVDDVFEVPLEFVLDVRNHLSRDHSIAGHTVVTHAIPYEGRQIWGATASMLITFARLLREMQA